MTMTAAQMVGSATARVPTVTPQDAWEEIVRGDAVVLDVREPVEWEEHIEGAVPCLAASSSSTPTRHHPATTAPSSRSAG